MSDADVRCLIKQALLLYDHPVFITWAYAWLAGYQFLDDALKASHCLIFVPYTPRWSAANAAVEAAIALAKEKGLDKAIEMANYWIYRFNN